MVQSEYETISKVVQKCLGDNQMSISDERAKQALPELKHLINDRYRKPLSRRLYRRARREYQQGRRTSRRPRARGPWRPRRGASARRRGGTRQAGRRSRRTRQRRW